MSIQDRLTTNQWGMQVTEASGNTVHLSIMSSAKSITGRYDVLIETNSTASSGDDSLFRHKVEEQIFVLFNPWCSGDFFFISVYSVI